MKAAPFRYHRATSVEDALAALAQPEASVLAGGQSLIPMMVMRLARPEVLVDVSRLEELSRIRVDNGWLEVGAAVTQRSLERHEATSRVPLLAAALPWIGHREIRNRGTVGGSIVHADPSAELPCIAAALDAQLVLRGPEGERVVGGRSFFTGAFQSAREAGELLERVRFPTAHNGEGYAFDEVARRHGDFALCGVAARVRLTGGDVGEATVGLLGVGDAPVVIDATEALRDASAEGGLDLAAAAAVLVQDLRPGSDMHASGDYRRRLAQALLRRCLRRAVDDARGAEA